jgi:hypothetical protein
MNHTLMETRGPSINLQDGCPNNVTFAYSPAANEHLLKQDWPRTLQVGITGFTFSGPITHAWYGILERLVTTRHYFLGVVLRMILDALLFSPVAVAGYFIWRGALEGKSLDGIIDKVWAKWQGAVVASWSFWPAANMM